MSDLRHIKDDGMQWEVSLLLVTGAVSAAVGFWCGRRIERKQTVALAPVAVTAIGEPPLLQEVLRSKVALMEQLADEADREIEDLMAVVEEVRQLREDHFAASSEAASDAEYDLHADAVTTSDQEEVASVEEVARMLHRAGFELREIVLMTRLSPAEVRAILALPDDDDRQSRAA